MLASLRSICIPRNRIPRSACRPRPGVANVVASRLCPAASTSRWRIALGALLLLGGVPWHSIAADTHAADIARIVDKLQSLVPELEARDIRVSAIPGVYEVVQGFESYYISADGEHLINGDIIKVSTGARLQPTGLNAKRRELMETIADTETVFYPAVGTQKAVVSVFTDVTCPYCRKLHQEIDALNDAGIAVRYLAFPRSGVPSGAAEQLVSIWCSEDRPAAMTASKTGQSVAERDCRNPIAEQYQLGATMAVRGTPTIVLDNGGLIGGYLPAAEIAARALKHH